MKFLAAGVFIYVLWLASPAPPALANDPIKGVEDPIANGETTDEQPSDSGDGSSSVGGVDTAGEQGEHGDGARVARTATASGVNLEADDAQTPEHEEIGQGTAVTEEEAPTATDDGPSCAQYQPGELSEDGSFSYSGFCLKRRVCGSERVDDVVSGRISGTETTGKYREYLDLVGERVLTQIDSNQLPAQGPTPSEVDNQVNSISDVLLAQGLGEPPTETRLPVFYWCTLFSIGGPYDPVDTWDITFGWDLTIDDVYNIDRVRQDLYIEVTAELDLYKPDIGLAPYTELGYTYILFPTWMFLNNPVDDIHRYAANDLDTLRVDLRASLVDVTWSFAGETIATCTSDQMVIYDRENSDVLTDLPQCHYRFPEFGYAPLTATVRYTIEEQVRSRQSSTLDEYPADSWSDYLGTETIISLDSQIPRYEVHALHSVNILPGISNEEAIARERAAGRIPELPNLADN